MNSATVVELVNRGTGILKAVMAIYAKRKADFAMVERGFVLITISGVLMAVIAPNMAYYTYNELYELIHRGRAGLTIAGIILLLGLYVLGKAAISMYGVWEKKLRLPELKRGLIECWLRIEKLLLYEWMEWVRV